MDHLFTADSLVALVTLTSLETVLGIDNVIFIAIVASRLPEEMRERARVVGLSLAVGTRVILLYMLTLFMALTRPLFTVAGHGFSGKDVIVICGGLFLIAKATHEIHRKFEDAENQGSVTGRGTFWGVIGQILVIDLVFSLDSVITAVGMSQDLTVMVLAVVISIGVMLAFSKSIVGFIERHPTVKMLALSFLILIGVLLVAEGFGRHIEKGYVYFAMAFSVSVEILNIRLSAKRKLARA